MQASVRQRQFHGVELMASYTLGKTRTNNRGFYGIFGGDGKPADRPILNSDLYKQTP